MHDIMLILAPRTFTLNPSFHGARFEIKVNVVCSSYELL